MYQAFVYNQHNIDAPHVTFKREKRKLAEQKMPLPSSPPASCLFLFPFIHFNALQGGWRGERNGVKCCSSLYIKTHRMVYLLSTFYNSHFRRFCLSGVFCYPPNCINKRRDNITWQLPAFNNPSIQFQRFSFEAFLYHCTHWRHGRSSLLQLPSNTSGCLSHEARGNTSVEWGMGPA